MSDNANAERAADLLVHYFRVVATAAGKTWDSDYSAEIRDIVDRLMDAVDDEIRAHSENSPHIYADGSTS